MVRFFSTKRRKGLDYFLLLYDYMYIFLLIFLAVAFCDILGSLTKAALIWIMDLFFFWPNMATITFYVT